MAGAAEVPGHSDGERALVTLFKQPSPEKQLVLLSLLK